MIILNKFLTCNTRDIYVCIDYTHIDAMLTVGYTNVSNTPTWGNDYVQFESIRYPYTINKKGRLNSLNYEKKGITSICVYFNGDKPINDSKFVVICLDTIFSFRYTNENIKMIVSEWAKN